MKKTVSIFSALLAGWLICGSAGCKKAEPPPQLDSLQQTVQKLRASLVKASPTVQSNFYNGLEYNVRYDNFLQAMMAADSILNDPSLNEEQKKLATSVIEQLKQKVQNQSQAKPAQ